jgi:hypothetical protein
MVKESGGITHLNAARTDACPGQPLSGGVNGSNYFLKSNEDSDITTLELGGLYLDISIEKADMGNIQVFDILGRPMVDYRQNLQAGSPSYQVPEAANWPAGTYQWRVKTDSGSITQGLLIKQ